MISCQYNFLYFMAYSYVVISLDAWIVGVAWLRELSV